MSISSDRYSYIHICSPSSCYGYKPNYTKSVTAKVTTSCAAPLRNVNNSNRDDQKTMDLNAAQVARSMCMR